MASMLYISFLGAFHLSLDAAVVTSVNTPRLRALLAYLALRRGVPQSRQQLAYLLWPDSGDAQARNNLRTLVHRLRAAVPDADAFLASDAHNIWWRADTPLSLDVAEFETALAKAEQAEQAGDDDVSIAALERAVALYRGEFLPDCFDDWVIPERERLQSLALNALVHLIDQQERRRLYATAIEHGRRLLRLDPLREATYLHLMRLHAANDDRAGALRVYHAYLTALRDELGAEPDPNIRAEYERLLASERSQASATARTASTPFVGRTAEWARTLAAWQAAAGGRSRLLLVSGDQGIGKTRLAEEMLAWAARQGIPAAIAHCYAAEGDLAYAPAAAWLRSDALQPRLARLDPIWLTEVGRLVPELLAARPDLPHPGTLTEGWQRQRLFEAMARATLADTGPLLLVIDDLQWCDPDTLEWLHFLLRYARRAPLLVIGTQRSEESPVEARLAALRDEAQRSNQLTTVALGPLSQAETAALAGHIVDRPLTPDAASALYTETEGTPLFVVEMLRSRTIHGAQAEPGTAALSVSTGLPASIEAAILSRLRHLTPPTRDLVALAAVIGRSFTFDVLARAAENDEDALVRGLDELWQRRIVREHGANGYDFSHDKLRAVTYSQLSTARRRVLHRRVAEALAQEHAADLDAVSGQLATHFERAGRPDQAITYYRRAAGVAQRIYANEEAIGHLQRALALQSATIHGAQRTWASTMVELSEGLGDLLHRTGQYAEARSMYQSALEHFEEDDPVARAELERKIGNVWRDQYCYEQALVAYASAEAALGALADASNPATWETWAQVQIERLQTHYWLAQTDEMFRLIAVARSVIEKHGSAVQRAQIYQFLALASVRRDRYVVSDEVVRYAHAFFSAVEELGDASRLPAARFGLGGMLLWRGDLDASEQHLRAVLDTVERTGDVSLEARCVTYLAIIHRKRGQADAVCAYAERGLRVATAATMPDYIGAAHANLAWLAWRAGDLAGAEALGHKAIGTWQATSLVFASQWTALWPLIGVALAANQITTVVKLARALLDDGQQRPPAQFETALEAAIRAGETGAPELARAEIERVFESARTAGYL